MKAIFRNRTARMGRRLLYVSAGFLRDLLRLFFASVTVLWGAFSKGCAHVHPSSPNTFAEKLEVPTINWSGLFVGSALFYSTDRVGPIRLLSEANR